MGSKPAPGTTQSDRPASRAAIALIPLLCLFGAGCGGPVENRERPALAGQIAEQIVEQTGAPTGNAADGIGAQAQSDDRPADGEAIRPDGERVGQDHEDGGRDADAAVRKPPPNPRSGHIEPQDSIPRPGRPLIVARGKSRLQCVPYARRHSGIAIRGDAWTWWRSARGNYQRGSVPAVGAVLVLKRRGRSRGHLAVVTHVISDREIVVDHANWLNRGRIHRNTPVRDVSSGNDWSAVRVWHVPTRRYGASTYRAYGFVYPVGRYNLISQLPPLPDRG